MVDEELVRQAHGSADRLPDRVYRIVRADIDHKRQRVVIGPWRMPTLNKLMPVGVAAAALIAVLFIGSHFIGSPASNVGGLASQRPASSSESASPSALAASAGPTAAADEGLPEGPFTVVDVFAAIDAPRITVTIPAPGWTSLPNYGGLEKGAEGDPPQSAMLLWSWTAGTTFQVYGDPCDWATTPRTDVTTVDALAAALAAQPSREASDPVDVTVGRYAGKHVTLHVPEDWHPSSNECDQGTFASYGVNGGEPTRTHQGPGQIDELWILDLDGDVAVIDVMYRPDTPPALIDEMRAIAESATFETR